MSFHEKSPIEVAPAEIVALLRGCNRGLTREEILRYFQIQAIRKAFPHMNEETSLSPLDWHSDEGEADFQKLLKIAEIANRVKLGNPLLFLLERHIVEYTSKSFQWMEVNEEIAAEVFPKSA